MSGAPTRVVHHCGYSFLESHAPAISTSIARGVRTPHPFPSNIRKQWFQAFSLCPFPLSPHGKSLLFLVISRLLPPSLRRKVRTFADWAVLHSPFQKSAITYKPIKDHQLPGGKGGWPGVLLSGGRQLPLTRQDPDEWKRSFALFF